MNRTPHASLAFKLEKPGMKPGFGDNVIAALKADAALTNMQPLFPVLPVSIADLEAANNKLATAVANKINGGRAATIALKQAVAQWNVAYSVTGVYISTVAAGNPAIIVAGGYMPTKSETAPGTIPGAAVNFEATINGKKGAIVARSKTSVPGADAYVFAVVPPTVAISFEGDVMILNVGETKMYISATTRKKLELYNLPKGSIHNVTMFAFNAAGSGPAATMQEVIPQ